ncbi:hypothetical protein GCM10012275_09210 [Longimycelium tulufanense]|uniref:Uncharacterized protein n=1 Tax=Longimycelium tulufanense TaxID=907463 RepID=A0A8J3CAU2_9PSEU|nr:hypothetical protein [Longimycelium tulufanense]GGM40415.1 hypothetical protein GCM10012275_09210 [Longimycelium tulufanense]
MGHLRRHPGVEPAASGAARHQRGAQMADLAYAVLLISVFLLFALSLRGLERL